MSPIYPHAEKATDTIRDCGTIRCLLSGSEIGHHDPIFSKFCSKQIIHILTSKPETRSPESDSVQIAGLKNGLWLIFRSKVLLQPEFVLF